MLIEYSHAMGNSSGNLREYWDVINQHEILAGGFIWDWVDQGLLEHDGEGTNRTGPTAATTDRRMCRRAATSTSTVSSFPTAACSRPTGRSSAYTSISTIEADSLISGDLTIHNNYDFTNLDEFELATGRSFEDGVVVQTRRRGRRPYGSAGEFDKPLWLPYNLRSLRAGPEHYLLNCSSSARASAALFPAGHVYAEQQFALPGHPAFRR